MAKGHSRGAAGGWRHGKTQAIRDEHGVIREYSAGPQNVNLDGSNYRGGQGATFSDIHKALARTGGFRTCPGRVGIVGRRNLAAAVILCLNTPQMGDVSGRPVALVDVLAIVTGERA